MNDNPRNPRRITAERLQALKDSLTAFGDLSGVIVNRATGRVVGGHQRLKTALQDDPKMLEAIYEAITAASEHREDGNGRVTISREYDKPTAAGTVSEGRIEVGNETLHLRIVDWPVDREQAAMIAANKHGGVWDDRALALLAEDLKSKGEQMAALGITPELEARLAAALEALKAAAKNDGAPPPSAVRMMQLYYSSEQHATIMAKINILWKYYGTKDTTETIIEAIKRQHALI